MVPKSRDDFVVAIICALPLEADAVYALFDEFYDDRRHMYGKQYGDANSYTTGRIGQHNVVLAHMPRMGKASAASVASSLLVSFVGIKLALVVGICGGVPFTADGTEIILGDAIISDSVIEYDFGRQYPDGFRKTSDIKDTLPPPNREIRSLLSMLRTRQISRRLREQTHQHLQILQNCSENEWCYPGTSYDVLFDASYRHKHHPPGLLSQCLCNQCGTSADAVCNEALISDCYAVGCTGNLIERTRLNAESPQPLIHIGTIASADTVMKSGEHRDKMAKMDGVIGFEMEGAGVWNNVPCVIIKGVCDYADSHKAKRWQKYAAATAASCAKAVLEYWIPSAQAESRSLHASIYLQNYYTTANRLKIQRISGELLPMDQCYINLTLLEPENSAEANNDDQYSPFSLFARLKVEPVDENKQVSLPKLFAPRKRRDDTSITPKRILIRGRAGVGKTTLCKKIVADYLHREMWRSLFDLLLWVPLRRLKETPLDNPTLVDLFYRLYFPDLEEGKDLARHLWKIIYEPTGQNRTLLLLDGMDEVSQEWDSETPMSNVLLRLLNHPYVIITSRPYGINLSQLESFDLELETIGFQGSQVEAYVRKIVKSNPKKVDDILSFIGNHELIQGLVRIPIQLDALCYSWDTDFVSGDETATMTTLYQAITRKLWQKDIMRLGKLDQDRYLNEHTILSLNDYQIEKSVPEEINLIESLAFIGLYNEIIEFNASDRHRIYDSLTRLGTPLPAVPDRALKKISFLHTSDTAVMDQDRSYHFLHLTFQEFFAACYFARHWINHQQLLCLDFRRNKTSKSLWMTPQTFLQNEKYKSRYDIFWRFVAGLLHRVAGYEQEPEVILKSFFRELEAEPRDLLGPAHQRTIMHCLSEVPTSNNQLILDNRAALEDQLLLWTVFECNLCGSTQLCRAMEWPEHLLDTILSKESGKVKQHVLEALGSRAKLPMKTIDTLLMCLKHEDTVVRWKAADGLGKQSALPREAINVLVTFLKDKDTDVIRKAASILGKQSDLPQEAISTLIMLLMDKRRGIRSSAAMALNGQFKLSKEAIKEAISLMVMLLRDEDVGVSQQAAYFLCKQPDLPGSTINALVMLLKEKDRGVIIRAANVLGKQSYLPREAIETLTMLLKDNDMGVKESATHALGELFLPERTVSELVLSLKDEDKFVRRRAADALGRRSNLPADIINDLVELLQDEDTGVRRRAASALGRQPDLPKTTVHALAKLLKHKDRGVRWGAVAIFSNLSDLPLEGIHALILLLKDENMGVRQNAVNALRKQPRLPRYAIDALILLLKDKDTDVRQRAVDILYEWEELPQEEISALAMLLKEKDRGVVTGAANVLGKQSDLPREAVSTLVGLLKDKDSGIRFKAIYILSKQSELPAEVIDVLVGLLKDEDMRVTEYAASALGRRSDLPEKAVDALVVLLKDGTLWSRREAAEALVKQPDLPREAIEALILFLGDEQDKGVETALRKHQAFYSVLPSLNSQCWKSLLNIWVKKSFTQQMSCYPRDNTLFISMPDGLSEIQFKNHYQTEVFCQNVRQAQIALNIPSPCQDRRSNLSSGP